MLGRNLALFCVLISFSSCKSRIKVSNPNIYNATYSDGDIPKLNDFPTYNIYEKTYDSIMATGES